MQRPIVAPAHLRLFLGGLALFFAGVGACYGILALRGRNPEATAAPQKTGDSTGGKALVHFERIKWEAAGIKLEPATLAPLTQRIWRPGRVALNQDRTAHIFPLMEGVVRDMKVSIGQEVRAGDVLAVIDSKELGQAKLDLLKNKQALQFAEHEHEWITAICKNTEYLLAALAKDVPLTKIEKHLRGKRVGEWRQKLISSYARRDQTQKLNADMERLYQAGGTSEANYRKAKADYESAGATYQALWDDINHEVHHQLHQVEHKLRETETALAVTRTHLMMMGFSKSAVNAMNPVGEEQHVSLFPIRAPFAGTILSRHVTISERVSPQAQVFELGDLSAVWIEAEVPEADLDFLFGLTGKQVLFKPGGRAGPIGEAVVQYPGDLVDKDTRAIMLRASAPNPERRWKPGMYVDVQLSKGKGTPVVQVPASAVQRMGKEVFVFVQEGDDKFRRVDVLLGRESSGQIEIKEGLRAEQVVVTHGGFALKSEMLRSELKEE